MSNPLTTENVVLRWLAAARTPGMERAAVRIRAWLARRLSPVVRDVFVGRQLAEHPTAAELSSLLTDRQLVANARDVLLAVLRWGSAGDGRAVDVGMMLRGLVVGYGGVGSDVIDSVFDVAETCGGEQSSRWRSTVERACAIGRVQWVEARLEGHKNQHAIDVTRMAKGGGGTGRWYFVRQGYLFQSTVSVPPLVEDASDGLSVSLRLVRSEAGGEHREEVLRSLVVDWSVQLEAGSDISEVGLSQIVDFMSLDSNRESGTDDLLKPDKLSGLLGEESIIVVMGVQVLHEDGMCDMNDWEEGIGPYCGGSCYRCGPRWSICGCGCKFCDKEVMREVECGCAICCNVSSSDVEVPPLPATKLESMVDDGADLYAGSVTDPFLDSSDVGNGDGVEKGEAEPGPGSTTSAASAAFAAEGPPLGKDLNVQVSVVPATYSPNTGIDVQPGDGIAGDTVISFNVEGRVSESRLALCRALEPGLEKMGGLWSSELQSELLCQRLMRGDDESLVRVLAALEEFEKTLDVCRGSVIATLVDDTSVARHWIPYTAPLSMSSPLPGLPPFVLPRPPIVFPDSLVEICSPSSEEKSLGGHCTSGRSTDSGGDGWRVRVPGRMSAPPVGFDHIVLGFSTKVSSLFEGGGGGGSDCGGFVPPPSSSESSSGIGLPEHARVPWSSQPLRDYVYGRTVTMRLPEHTTIIGLARGASQVDDTSMRVLPNRKPDLPLEITDFDGGVVEYFRGGSIAGICLPRSLEISGKRGIAIARRLDLDRAADAPIGHEMYAGALFKPGTRMQLFEGDITPARPLADTESISPAVEEEDPPDVLLQSKHYCPLRLPVRQGSVCHVPPQVLAIPEAVRPIIESSRRLELRMPWVPVVIIVLFMVAWSIPGLVQYFLTDDTSSGDVINQMIGTGSVLVGLVLYVLKSKFTDDSTRIRNLFRQMMGGNLSTSNSVTARCIAPMMVRELERLACRPSMPDGLIKAGANSLVRVKYRCGWLDLGTGILRSELSDHGYALLGEKGLILDLFEARFYRIVLDGDAELSSFKLRWIEACARRFGMRLPFPRARARPAVKVLRRGEDISQWTEFDVRGDVVFQ